MARPKKAKEFTHPHRVYLRLSDLEYEIVSNYAHQANLTIAEFCRQQIVGKKVVVKSHGILTAAVFTHRKCVKQSARVLQESMK